jgi:hypothetical protein
MKRKGVNVPTEAGKRQRTAVKEMREADCVYDRAAPHLADGTGTDIQSLWSNAAASPRSCLHRWSEGQSPHVEPHQKSLQQEADRKDSLHYAHNRN